MIITWHGLSCFRIQTKDSTIVVDPFDQSVGIKPPIPSKLTADIIVSSKDGAASRNFKAVGGDPFCITTPGEYEVKNTFVYGYPIPSGKGEGSIFRVEAEDLTIAHISALSAPLENGEIEMIEEADIVFLPVGGDNGLDYKNAVKLVSEIEPRIIIPCLYDSKGLKMKLDPLEKILKELGVKNPETVDKFKITRKDLPQEEVKVIVLEPQT